MASRLLGETTNKIWVPLKTQAHAELYDKARKSHKAILKKTKGVYYGQ